MLIGKSLLVLSLVFVVTEQARLKRQISFGGNSVSRDRPTSQHKASSSVSFASEKKEGKETKILLKDILRKEAAASTQLQTRFNFGSSEPRLGVSCQTPLGESGECSLITSSSCKPVMSAIIRHGVTPVILRHGTFTT